MIILTIKEVENKSWLFDVYLDDEKIFRSKQPLYDGARYLLFNDYDPDKLMTIQLHNREYVSFKPMPISYYCEFSVQESNKSGLKTIKWMPVRI